MKKVLIVDLDGTIRRTKSGKTFINEPDDQEIIPEASEAMYKAVRKGWVIVGCTNQGGVAAGFKTLENCIEEQKLTIGLARYAESDGSIVDLIKAIAFCPHEDECGLIYPRTYYSHIWLDRSDFSSSFRKPETGMVEAIKKEFNPTELLMVGDMESDRLCAEKANIPFIWEKDWWENA